MRDENQLHAAIVEIIVKDNAEVKYSTVQNWKSSRGARIEFRVAKFLGIQIWFQNNPGEEKVISSK